MTDLLKRVTSFCSSIGEDENWGRQAGWQAVVEDAEAEDGGRDPLADRIHSIVLDALVGKALKSSWGKYKIEMNQTFEKKLVFIFLKRESAILVGSFVFKELIFYSISVLRGHSNNTWHSMGWRRSIWKSVTKCFFIIWKCCFYCGRKSFDRQKD